MNLDCTLICGGGWRQCVPKSITRETECETENMKNNYSEINTLKFYFFMLSSNDWTVQLVANNHITPYNSYNNNSYCTFPTVKMFGNFVLEVLFPAF